MNTSIHLITSPEDPLLKEILSQTETVEKISSKEEILKNMSKENIFTNTILSKLQEKLGPDYQVMAEKVTKNNGVVLTGLIAKKKGSSVFPTVYIDNFYKEDMTEREYEQLVLKLQSRVLGADFEEKVDLSDFTVFEKAKERLAYKLVHAERNEEFLKDVPHRRYHNLAIIFYYHVQERPFCGNASIVIKNEHLKTWKVTTEEVYQAAIVNTPVLFPPMIQNMEEVMRGLLKSGLKEDISRMRAAGNSQELFDDDWAEELLSQMSVSFQQDQDKIPMYVLTNQQKLNGAACILYPDVLKKFGEEMKTDFYILPSSVHEMILVPALPGTEAEMLRYIVSDINRTQVAEDEILADSVYFYSRSRDRLEWLC